jgi:hypothetical protein
MLSPIVPFRSEFVLKIRTNPYEFDGTTSTGYRHILRPLPTQDKNNLGNVSTAQYMRPVCQNFTLLLVPVMSELSCVNDLRVGGVSSVCLAGR